MRIALELVPAHRTIDDGYSRYMYSVTNAVLAHDTTNEFLIILGAQGNRELLHLSPRAALVQCSPRNQNINQQWTAARMARRWGADVLHNFGAPASLFWSKKLILTIHDASIATHPELFPTRWVMFQKYAYAALKKKHPFVVTVSEFSRGEIAAHMGFSADRIRVVYPIPAYGERRVDANELAAARVRYRLPKKYFLHVGVIEPRKNLVRLISAFDEYRAAGGDASLVIGGNIGWKAQPVSDAARASSYSADIHFTGYIDDGDLPAVIAGAHAFVFPSTYEGFGYPPVEALMFDVPVCASRAASLLEVLGDAALYFDPLDVHAIADALNRIDGDAAMRHSLIEHGRTQRARYSAGATAQAMVRVYDEVARA